MNEKKHVFLICLAVGIIGLLPMSVFGQERIATGRLYGNVKNVTTGSPVDGLELELRVFEGNNITEQLKAFSDAEGTFSFSNLERNRKKRYALFTVYQGVDYYGPMHFFDEQSSEIRDEMLVYDSTDSNQNISISRHHFIIKPEESVLRIREVIILENKGNTVYAGEQEIQDGKKATILVSLPPGSKDLQLEEGLAEYYVFRTEDGFVDTRAIEPGIKQIAFGYTLDGSSSPITLTKTMQFDTGSFDVFVPTTGVRLESQELEYIGTFGETGQEFLRFSASQLLKEARVAFSLQYDVAAPENSILLKGGPIVVIVLMVLGFLYSLFHGWKKAKESSSEQEQEPEEEFEEEKEEREEIRLEAERHQLLVGVIELDKQFTARQMSAKQYKRKRQHLIEQVLQITEMLHDNE